jgi:hypothetical protein
MEGRMVAVILVICFMPIFIIMCVSAGKRLAAERARRIEAYRASPESHLLNLK